MTPDDLLALVENNARRYEKILIDRDTEYFESVIRLAKRQQKTIASWDYAPQQDYSSREAWEQEILQLISQRAADGAYWRAQVDAACADIERLQDERHRLQQQNSIIMRRMHLELADDPVLLDLDKQRQAIADKKRQLTSSHDELVRESVEKLPDYENNFYYRFLRSISFGTPQYSRSRLLRSADTWLAKKINYQENRRNELLLRAMPQYLEDAIKELAIKDRDLNLQVRAAWQKRQPAIGLDSTSSKNRLLASQIVGATRRMLDTWEKLEAVTHDRDSFMERIQQSMHAQLGYDAFGGRHVESINMLMDDRDYKTVLFNESVTASNHARTLLLALYDLRREENGSDCSRAGHHPDQYGRCVCVYEEDRYYEYPELLNFPQLIAGYMRQDLSLEELIDVFRNGRRYFRDLRPDDRLDGLAIASTDHTAS